MTVLIFLLVVLLVVWTIGSIIQMDCFLYYEETYNKLVNGTAVFDYHYGKHYYFCNPSNKGKFTSDIIVFVDKNGNFQDVKVGPWNYIHGGVLTYISPYTLYWWFKYKDWFEKNRERFDKVN